MALTFYNYGRDSQCVLFSLQESGQTTNTPLSLDTAKHSRYIILHHAVHAKIKTPPPPRTRRSRSRPEEPENFEKNKKTNPEWTYPRFFSQDCFFCFPRVFGQLGLGQQKPREKQKNKKVNGLIQCSSHRIDFCFDIDLGILAMEKQQIRKTRERTKRATTQRSQRSFLFFKYINIED